MPRNDDGEYELVLGNRQLLSGFFFVVVLFGIFFTMGYFVGRHSSSGTVNAGQPPATATAERPVEQPVAQTTTPSDATPPEPGQAQVVTAPPASTKPVAEPPVATPVEEKPKPKPVETAKATPPPPVKETPAPKPAPVSTASGKVITPSAGDIYLQVAAPAPAAAGSVVEALKRKGIQSVLAPGPDASTVRVLVGPLVPADVSSARTQLEGAGFKPFLRKY